MVILWSLHYCILYENRLCINGSWLLLVFCMIFVSKNHGMDTHYAITITIPSIFCNEIRVFTIWRCLSGWWENNELLDCRLEIKHKSVPEWVLCGRYECSILFITHIDPGKPNFLLSALFLSIPIPICVIRKRIKFLQRIISSSIAMSYPCSAKRIIKSSEITFWSMTNICSKNPKFNSWISRSWSEASSTSSTWDGKQVPLYNLHHFMHSSTMRMVVCTCCTSHMAQIH